MTITGSWLAADAAFAQPPAGGGETQVSKSTAPKSSSSKSSSGSSRPRPEPPVITPSLGDSTLRKDSPNTNEGANPLIRVSVRPVRRGLVQFDPGTVAAMREAAANDTVYLTLHIAANNNSWSQNDIHYVDVHPLPENFWVVEGLGKASGLPADQVERGDGAGVTWKMPYDPDTVDTKGQRNKALPANWQGGDLVMLNATAPGQQHYNGLSGQISWDVTLDVRDGANAWIVKVRDEDEPAQTAEQREQGFDPFRGAVDYYSREGAAAQVGCVYPPMLQVVEFNKCSVGSGQTGPGGPGGSSSGSGPSNQQSAAVGGF